MWNLLQNYNQNIPLKSLEWFNTFQSSFVKKFSDSLGNVKRIDRWQKVKITISHFFMKEKTSQKQVNKLACLATLMHQIDWIIAKPCQTPHTYPVLPKRGQFLRTEMSHPHIAITRGSLLLSRESWSSHSSFSKKSLRNYQCFSIFRIGLRRQLLQRKTQRCYRLTNVNFGTFLESKRSVTRKLVHLFITSTSSTTNIPASPQKTKTQLSDVYLMCPSTRHNLNRPLID